MNKKLKEFNLKYNEGYVYGEDDLKNVDEYKISFDFIIKNYLKLDEDLFSFEDNCYYLTNHCHIEKRGGHRYLRPSNCSKFVFKQGLKYFFNYEYLYSYHGTHPDNIKSIIDYGLKVPGSNVGDKKINIVNGNVYGNGIYTSKLPLYSQLYAPVVEFKGYFIQTIFMVRQDPNAIKLSGIEGCYTANMIGRTDIHKLYDGEIKEGEVQFLTTDESANILHSLLIKVHSIEPTSYPNGEYNKISQILDEKLEIKN
jgi:hypothetical protein